MKANRFLSLAALASFSLAGVSHAAPLVALGDFGDLYFNGSASLRYQDNVLLTPSNKTDDFTFIFSPGLELTMGQRGSEFTGSLVFREDFLFYSDLSELDNQNANIFLNAAYNTGVFRLNMYARWQQVDQNTTDIRRAAVPNAVLGAFKIEREVSAAGARGEYRVSDKTAVAAGFTVDHTNFRNKTLDILLPDGVTVVPIRFFSDHTTYGFPVDFYYIYSPKLDFSVGYRYRNTEVLRDEYADHFFNVGVRGELAPKLDGEIRLGYQKRRFDIAPISESTFSILSALTYQASPKALFRLSLDRDFGASGDGASNVNTGLGISGMYRLSPLMAIDGSFGYNNYNYANSPREDDTYSFGIGISYTPNEFIRLSAGYVYQRNNSNAAGLDYKNNVINLVASLRY